MSQSKSVFLFSINLRQDLRQTAAHRLIGLLREAAQNQRSAERRSEDLEKDYTNFYKKNQPVKSRVYYARKITEINNYDKRQTARKTKELNEKKNQN